MRKINASAPLLLLFLFADAAFAQGMLQGVVTTPEGTALPGACCLYLNQEGLENRIGPQSTRGGGYYRFSNVRPGIYNLETEIPGFFPMKIAVRVFAAEPTKFDMRLQREIREEVIVPRKQWKRLAPGESHRCFSEGLGVVVTDGGYGEYGYIDKEGHLIIEPKFDLAADFSEGLAVVKINGEYGYINTKGKIVIEPKCFMAYRFSGGLARVLEHSGGDWSYINKKGKLIVGQKIHHAYDIKDGLARVNFDRKYGYINRTGNFVIKPSFASAEDFSEGLAAVWIDDKWGFIDKTGKIIIEPRFEGVHKFSEKLAPAWTSSESGYIDKSGEMVIQLQGYRLENFSEGLARVQKKSNLKWGYIDKQGKTAIPPQFDSALDFSEGLAAVEIDGKWGYVNRAGKMVIDPQYESAEKFSEGLAYVVIRREIGIHATGTMISIEHCYINKKGQYVWKSPTPHPDYRPPPKWKGMP